MPDTFAHGVRRRPQAPRPIAQACSVRSEGMTGLEAGRLPTAHRASGPSPAGTSGASPTSRPAFSGLSLPPLCGKAAGGFMNTAAGLLGSGGNRNYSFQGILTCGWEVSDAPEGRIQEDEPERGGEAPHRLQSGHGSPGQVHDRRAIGVHPGVRPEAPVAGAAPQRPLAMSASSERQRLEAESQDLNYRWDEEV